MDIKNIGFNKNNNYTIKINAYGHFYIECKKMSNKTFYQDIFILLPRDMNKLVEDKKKYYKIVDSETKKSRNKTKELFKQCNFNGKQTKNEEPLNILMIILDSFSHNHARRMIPLTYDYLKSWKQDNQIFENYMLIGMNTKPNLFPLFTGKFVSSMRLKNEDTRSNYHNLSLFWKDFEKLGYISMYNEDFLIHGNF